jgi:alpha-tubulin suppressor-like RCC1 family protein
MPLIFSGITTKGSFGLVYTLPPPPVSYLWSWGRNNNGQLGLGDTTNRSSPTQIGAGYSNVSASESHALVLKTNGTLWAMGSNSLGNLGLGDNTQRSSPVQVGALTTWSTISAGAGSHSMAIKTDGTLWAWGYYYQGQLGLGESGSFTGKSSPVQVGALTNWLRISSGNYHNVSVKTDGTMWSWGQNDSGQLGVSGTYSSPIQVGGLTTWLSVACGSYHSIAVTTGGSMWAWGRNANGRLGLGDTNNRSSPVQIGALTNWATNVDSFDGGRLHSMAIKTDGTLWAWGSGDYGQLGLGNSTAVSSPNQVGALTNWLRTAAGAYAHTMATKTDGTLWTWGQNSYGKLGLGNTTEYASPKQVGSLTTWTNISAGRRYSMAFAAV